MLCEYIHGQQYIISPGMVGVFVIMFALVCYITVIMSCFFSSKEWCKVDLCQLWVLKEKLWFLFAWLYVCALSKQWKLFYAMSDNMFTKIQLMPLHMHWYSFTCVILIQHATNTCGKAFSNMINVFWHVTIPTLPSWQCCRSAVLVAWVTLSSQQLLMFSATVNTILI